MNWQQEMETERKSKNFKKSQKLVAAIRDYQKSNEVSQKFYQSNFEAWVKQLKKLDAELAEYMGL